MPEKHNLQGEQMPEKETGTHIGSLTDLGLSLIDSALAKPYNATLGLVLPELDLSESYDHTCIAAKVGDFGGSIVDMVALSKVTGWGVSKGMSWGARRGLLAASLAESPMLASTLSLGSTGALYGGVFTPGSASERLKNASVGFATFSTLGAATSGLGKFGILGKTGTRTLMQEVAVGGMSGIPAGLVNAEATSLVNGKGLTFDSSVATTSLYFAAFGAAMGGAGHGLARGGAKVSDWLSRSSTKPTAPLEAKFEPAEAKPAPAEIKPATLEARPAASESGPPPAEQVTIKSELPELGQTESKPFSFGDVTMKVKDPALLKQAIANNAETELGTKVLQFANKWATMMEEKMAAGEPLTPEMAWKTHLEAFPEVRNYHYDIARNVLVETWEHGAALDRVLPAGAVPARSRDGAVPRAHPTPEELAEANTFGSMLLSLANSRSHAIEMVRGMEPGNVNAVVRNILLEDLLESRRFLRQMGVDSAESGESIVRAMNNVPESEIPRFVHYVDQFHHDPFPNSVMSRMDQAVANGQIPTGTIPAWIEAISAKMRIVFPGIPESQWAITALKQR